MLTGNKLGVWCTSGVRDLNHLTVYIKRHLKTVSHCNAIIDYEKLGKNDVLETMSKNRAIEINEHNQKVKCTRIAIGCIVKCIMFLGKQGLAFRGHDDSEQSFNKGNFKEIINFIRTENKYLDDHLKNSLTEQYTSPLIQNEFINLIYTNLLNMVKEEIKKTDFVSLILDETTDLSLASQMAVILRYCSNGVIKERFLFFLNVSHDKTAKGLFDAIFSFIENYGLKNKLIGQCYDGARVMSSEKNGLQAKIKNVCPYANYTYCYAHKLNILVKNALYSIQEVVEFFDTTDGISNFFTNSTKKEEILKTYIKHSVFGVCKTK